MPKKLSDNPEYQELVELLKKQSTEQRERLSEMLNDLEEKDQQKDFYLVDLATPLFFNRGERI